MHIPVSRPKVSVVIPTYNSEQFIRQTIDSVFNQSYHDFEVIVVDDGSSDRIDRIISSYGSRLTYIRKKNEGISVARNTGIAQAQGEYIAFIDHDDIWLPEKLEEQMALLEDNKAIGLCFSDAYIISEGGERSRNLFKICPPHSGIVFKQLLQENFIPVLTVVVKKEVFKKIGLFNPHYKIAEDWDLFLRITKQYPVAFINRPLAEYRVHKRSFSRQRGLICLESIEIINKYIETVDKTTAKRLKMKKRNFRLEAGMVYLCSGMKDVSRDYFLANVREEPLSFYYYTGLLVTYLPNIFIKLTKQILSSRRLNSL